SATPRALSSSTRIFSCWRTRHCLAASASRCRPDSAGIMSMMSVQYPLPRRIRQPLHSVDEYVGPPAEAPALPVTPTPCCSPLMLGDAGADHASRPPALVFPVPRTEEQPHLPHLLTDPLSLILGRRWRPRERHAHPVSCRLGRSKGGPHVLHAKWFAGRSDPLPHCSARPDSCPRRRRDQGRPDPRI